MNASSRLSPLLAEHAFHADSPPLPDDTLTLPATARTLGERAYHQLRQHIIEGHYPPDMKLRVEHLKNVYGVGAGTLREALTRLVSDALVVAEGQRGFRVMPMSVTDLEDITRLRLLIEVDALRNSIRHGDAAWEARVRKSFEALSAWEQPVSHENRPAWEEANRKFHEALIAAAASPWTYLVLRVLSQHSERYRYLSLSVEETKRDLHAEHTHLFEAAMQRADARAALVLEDHISATLEVVKRTLVGTLPLAQAARKEVRRSEDRKR